MKPGVTAAAWAEQQVTTVRDNPASRLALMQRCCYGPFGKAPRHLPYRRAATAFMLWLLQRGVLQPQSSDRPGSPWWRVVNERILRDGCEAVALSGGLPGPASSCTVDHYEWSAHELAAPGLLGCVRDGAMTYAWSYEDRSVWQPSASFILQMTQRALPPWQRGR